LLRLYEAEIWGQFFNQSIKTIAWAFLAIYGSKRLEMDFESLSILHIIVANLISTAVFIGTLLIVIHWVVLKLNS
jgi:hypothetical protein